MNSVAELFLRLAAYNTQSDYESSEYPSTPAQTAFANMLADECTRLGLSNVRVIANAYVTAELPANTAQPAEVIGLIAHMDTSPDASGANVKPQTIQNYDGSVIQLNAEHALSPEEFPHLLQYTGQDLIVTDGSTLLGADDKAGIAEILTAMEYLLNHPEVKHGTVKIGFTPDEEVGRGVDHFDVKSFGADYAYTVDGGELGELEYETFNAARAIFKVAGKSVHPGLAYHTMRNAAGVAAEMIAAFPPDETPGETEDRAGFYHLSNLNGEVGEATFSFLLRDFEADGLERRKSFVREITERFNQKYGTGTVSVEIRDEYRNMAEILVNRPEIVERAKKAMEACDVKPIIKPIRGGTDGSRLSFMGLPCPNLFTGGHNFHGPYEYIPIPSMEAAVRVLVRICGIKEG